MTAPVKIEHWSPPEWEFTLVPLPGENVEVVEMAFLVAALHTHVDAATEADTTNLCAALHVAHLFVTLQGSDGLWPAAVNARTGTVLTEERTAAPITLLRRLDALTDACEFDAVCERAEKESLPCNSPTNATA